MRERSGERDGSRRSLKRLARREVAALSLAGLVVLLVTAGALAVTGDLTQPAGNAGCISDPTFGGAEPCAEGHGLINPTSVAVSPGGKSVYLTSTSSNAVVRLNRNTTTGAITQPAGSAGCVSQNGIEGCAAGHGLINPYGVAVSADGKSVYVASAGSDAVARFNRNTTTGALSQPAGTAGCVSETGAGLCADGHGLDAPRSMAVSADGKSVYVVSDYSSTVVRLNRNTTTGAISQPGGTAGCISETGAGPCANGHGLLYPYSVAVSPGGKSVYVASAGSEAVARLNRNTTTGALTQPAGAAGCISETGAGPCANGHGLGGAFGVAVTPNGKNIYVASNGSNAVARLNRNTTTGALTQPAGAAGCISETGAGPCANGHGLSGPFGVAVSLDGKNAYVASYSSNAVARLNRNPTTGALAQPAGAAGCVSETGAGPCANGHGLMTPRSVAVSANGKSVYLASSDGHAVARFNRAP